MKKSFTAETIETNINRLIKCFPQLTEGYNAISKPTNKIAKMYEELAYPYHPNWRYCIPLKANHTLKDGTVVDIGININDEWILNKEFSLYHCISANFVTSNDGPDYYSGNISPTSEMSKIALRAMKYLEMIDDKHIMGTIANHNRLLDKFMEETDLTVWDLEKFIKSHIKES